MSTRRPKIDRRAAAVLVEQWDHEHGPEVWFVPGHGRTMAECAASALRLMLDHTLRYSSGARVRSAWVQENGQWVPA